MQKIDRLGWAAGMSVYTYGLRIGIRTNQAAVLEQVEARLPAGWESACSPYPDYLYSLKVGGSDRRGQVRSYTLLYGGLAQLARTMDLEEALDALESDLHVFLARRAQNRVFVHAGVVGWRGRAILLPAASRGGKSSLVAALVRAGASYFSDEFAVLDARGQVYPFARRLSLRQAGGVPDLRVTAEELGGQTAVGPLPVGLVVLTRYRPGSTWRPRAVSAGPAALDVLGCTMSSVDNPESALSVLRRVTAAARCVRGPRGEADEAARALLEMAA